MYKFITIAAFVLFLLCLFLGFRLTGIGRYSWVFAGIMTGLLLLYPLVWYDVLPDLSNKTLRAITHFNMGMLSLIIAFIICRDLIFIPITLIRPGLFSQAFSGTTTSLMFIVALVLMIYGYSHAKAGPALKTVEIPIPDLKAGLVGFTILQISDLHAGPAISRGYVQNVLAKVKNLEVDLIALTGDIADGKFSKYKDRVVPIAELRRKAPVLYIPGNHEYLHDSDQWFTFFGEMGFKSLFNAHTQFTKNKASILFAGIIDPEVKDVDSQQKPDIQTAIKNSPHADLKILLSHRPDMAKEASAIFDLQLSGHTHGGQFFPWNIAIKIFQPFSSGLKKYDNMWVYTNPGTGFWGPPIRLGTTSEITLIKLVRAKGLK